MEGTFVAVAFLVEVGLATVALVVVVLGLGLAVLVGALTGAAVLTEGLDSDETGAALLLDLLELQLFF